MECVQRGQYRRQGSPVQREEIPLAAAEDHSGRFPGWQHGGESLRFQGQGELLGEILLRLPRRVIRNHRSGTLSHFLCVFVRVYTIVKRSIRFDLYLLVQMKKQHKLKNMVLGKGSFGVTIFPNVDQAFIVALIMVLDEINKESGSSGGGGSDATELAISGF